MTDRSSRDLNEADAPMGDGWALPRMFGRGLVLGVVTAILAVGAGASALLYHQSEVESDREERNLAVRASRILQASTAALAAALAGASALTTSSGTVEQDAFNTFASGAVASTSVPSLSFVPVVSGDRRAEFEEAANLAITVRGANGFITADTRPYYLPVQFAYPSTATSRSIIGFDTASDPARLATSNAAREAGTLVFSPPEPSQPSGQTSVFFAQPLFARGDPPTTGDQGRGAIIGFITGVLPSSFILESVTDQLPGGARLSITDSGEHLAATADLPTDGHSSDVEQRGRTWTIDVEYDSADHRTTFVMVMATLVLAAVVAALLLRNVRKTRQLREAAMTVRRLGRLSERLSFANDRDQMVQIILDNAATIVQSAAISVALWSGDDRLRVASGLRRSDESSTSDAEYVHVDPSTPIGAALRVGAPVFVHDVSMLRAQFGGALGRWAHDELESGAALPIRRPSGDVMGVIEWAWSRPNRFDEGLRSNLLTAAEVCQQSLYRSEVQDLRWKSASALSEMSQKLSVSRTFEQIADVVVRHASLASGADHAAIGFVNEGSSELHVFHVNPADVVARSTTLGLATFDLPLDPSGALWGTLKRGLPIRFDGASEVQRFPVIADLVGERLRRIVCMPLIDSDKKLRGVIGFVYLSGSDLRLQPEAGRLDTIADLTAQTLERSLLYQHEHELVVNLQRQTLSELPRVPGLRIAASYLPASTLLGLGGDWYDVHVLDDGRVGVVVGDVAGHGIDAIADMTEFRTTISTLLRTNADLVALPGKATALLIDDSDAELRFATAGLSIIDVTERRMSYVRAGHPPAMVRTPDGEVHVLEGVGSAPIGIASTVVHQHEFEIPSGSVILTYTDGLIERRHESIDIGLARLAEVLRNCGSDNADFIVETVIDECLGRRQTADDTAVLVIVVE